MASKRKAARKIGLGVAVIILGLIFPMTIDFVFKMLMENRLVFVSDRGDAIIPVLWAAAVYLFIIAGSAFENSKIIANNEAHMAEVEKEKRYGWVFGAGMPLAAMAFLALGFIWNAWHPGWLVFPAAALICTAIVGRYQSRR